MRKGIVVLLMGLLMVVMSAAPAFADKPVDKPYWQCSFEGVQFTATPKAAQEIKREQGRGTCEIVHPTH